MKKNGTANQQWTIALIIILCVQGAGLWGAEICGPEGSPDVLKRWHRISLTFDGPQTSEAADPNLHGAGCI